MKKVKSFHFKMELEGSGIVNYDNTKDQKEVWNSKIVPNGNPYITKNNVSVAKKNLYKNEDGSYSHKVKISQACLRNHIYDYTQSPSVMHNDYLLLALIATPAALLRGYSYPSVGIKRSSSLSIFDAEQTNGALSKLEFFSRSGEKVTKEAIDSDSDTSIFVKETVGEITYSTGGFIDVMELQFISCSPNMDRLALNSDSFVDYSDLLKRRLYSFNSSLGYYKITNCEIELPEYGILLSNEDLNILIKYQLTQLLKMSINRAGAYASTTSLKIKPIYDPLIDTKNNDENWIEVTPEFIDSLNFDFEIFYSDFDFDKAVALETAYKEERKSADLEKREKKAEEKAKKEAEKAKKEAEKAKKEAEKAKTV